LAVPIGMKVGTWLTGKIQGKIAERAHARLSRQDAHFFENKAAKQSSNRTSYVSPATLIPLSLNSQRTFYIQYTVPVLFLSSTPEYQLRYSR
jgi:hypothetical protein